MATDENADRLTAFSKHSHSGRLLQLEGGPHSGITASVYVNLQALTDGMTANDHRKKNTGSTTVLRNEI